MSKLAVQLLIFSMLTALLPVTAVVTQAEAATTSTKHVKKKMRVVHQRPKAADPYSSPFSSNRYDDDFDRKNAGGGGGY